METDFLSTWNSILLFGDFFRLAEIQFLKNNLIPASGTDFLDSDSFIFPSNVNVFVNKSYILVSQSGFSA